MKLGGCFLQYFPKITPKRISIPLRKGGKFLFEEAYQDKEAFTKDDMMDAFMKGCSVAQQHLSEKYGYIIHTVSDETKRNREIMKDVKEILSSINSI